MQFQLTKKSADRMLTKFHVVDGNDNIVGSINVRNEDANDLVKCWQGSVVGDSPQRQPKQSATSVLAAAFLKSRNRSPFSKAAILRGCC